MSSQTTMCRIQVFFFATVVNEMIDKPKQLYLLYKRYQMMFPSGKIYKEMTPTPFICACEHGLDVEHFINLHKFYKYIYTSKGMDIEEMVNKSGIDSNGNNYTPLIIASIKGHTNVVKYLINYGANANFTNEYGGNALHYAVRSTVDTDTVELLLNNMTLKSINQISNTRLTPVDYCLHYNKSPIQQHIIALLRTRGARKASEL